jgi:triosephosphate isomerase
MGRKPGEKPRPLVAGNWKMNGLRASLAEIRAMAAGFDSALQDRIDLLVCPPATLIAAAAAAVAGSGLAIGAQDCHARASGAHTGDLSAPLLADAGASQIIVGHSERRADHGESDAAVKAKAEAVLAASLCAILCVGETEAERKAGRTLEIVGRQLAGSLPAGASPENLIVAYEPVWAIGSGLTPTPADVAQVHGFIRDQLGKLIGAEHAAGVRILYGGSVKPSNAAELMAVANVDGALVGGASLLAKDFLAIASVYR